MLSLSTDMTGGKGDSKLILGDDMAARESDIPFAVELLQFAGAVVSRKERELERTRERLLSVAGEAVVVDAACVAGNFQRMVRIADATGIPIDSDRMPLMNQAVDELGLRRFESSRHTPKMGFFQGLLASFHRRISVSKLRQLDRLANRDG
jgi:hypothetical protein